MLVLSGDDVSALLDAAGCIDAVRGAQVALSTGRAVQPLRLATHLPREVEHLAMPGARAAVEGADVVCTVTSATEPVVRDAWLAAGAHVNAAVARLAHERARAAGRGTVVAL